MARANSLAVQKHWFHWFIEFPDIFARGGFDCILGNPPYLGGQKLSGTYGDGFLSFVRYTYTPAKGWADLVTFFVRRIFDALNLNGFFAIITTNTIAQGDTKEGGLDLVCANGHIIFVQRSIRWPGTAAVRVSLLAVTRKNWQKEKFLDGRSVPRIGAAFDEAIDTRKPEPLRQNPDKCFKGFEPNVEGFILDTAEARELLSAEPRNREVVFKYITGRDISGSPDSDSTRWIIYFDEMSEDQAPAVSEFVTSKRGINTLQG